MDPTGTALSGSVQVGRVSFALRIGCPPESQQRRLTLSRRSYPRWRRNENSERTAAGAATCCRCAAEARVAHGEAGGVPKFGFFLCSDGATRSSNHDLARHAAQAEHERRQVGRTMHRASTGANLQTCGALCDHGCGCGCGSCLEPAESTNGRSLMRRRNNRLLLSEFDLLVSLFFSFKSAKQGRHRVGRAGEKSKTT